MEESILNNSDAEYKESRLLGEINDQYIVCCEIEPSTTTANAPSTSFSTYLPTAPVCGTFFGSLVGGHNTEIDEFPWAALMQYTYPNGEKGFHCGGVLISDQYVLITSNCVNGKGITNHKYKLTGVRLGEWNTETENDCDTSLIPPHCSDPHRDFKVEEIFVHENFDPDNPNAHNDIALIRLSEKIGKFTQYIKPICLPIEESLRNFDSTNAELTITGWGRTLNSSQSDIKQTVGLKGLNNEECQKAYSNRSSNKTITSSQICARGEFGENACNGDTGGPLMRKTILSEYPYWYLVGLESYGPSPCDQKGWPGVYTRVDQYLDWIISKLRP